MYYPEFNCVTEKCNKTLKEGIQLVKSNGLTWVDEVIEHLIAYRLIPDQVMNKMPFELFRGRRPNCKLVPGWMKWQKGWVNVETQVFRRLRELSLHRRLKEEYDVSRNLGW